MTSVSGSHHLYRKFPTSVSTICLFFHSSDFPCFLKIDRNTNLIISLSFFKISAGVILSVGLKLKLLARSLKFLIFLPLVLYLPVLVSYHSTLSWTLCFNQIELTVSKIHHASLLNLWHCICVSLSLKCTYHPESFVFLGYSYPYFKTHLTCQIVF